MSSDATKKYSNKASSAVNHSIFDLHYLSLPSCVVRHRDFPWRDQHEGAVVWFLIVQITVAITTTILLSAIFLIRCFGCCGTRLFMRQWTQWNEKVLSDENDVLYLFVMRLGEHIHLSMQLTLHSNVRFTSGCPAPQNKYDIINIMRLSDSLCNFSLVSLLIFFPAGATTSIENCDSYSFCLPLKEEFIFGWKRSIIVYMNFESNESTTRGSLILPMNWWTTDDISNFLTEGGFILSSR